ncbi:MAG: hypothetical protein IBX71_06230 [Candidatus Desulforudis sp.]|nr:hypothetical protein [Desulforudis sp.]
MQERNADNVRVYPVRFRYIRPSRYYRLTETSGYPSAEYRMPYAQPDEYRIVVREIQDQQ